LNCGEYSDEIDKNLIPREPQEVFGSFKKSYNTSTKT
jgi:hypothetical protein